MERACNMRTEKTFLLERRHALGGFVPKRKVFSVPMKVPGLDAYKEFLEGSSREVSTTMAFVRMLTKLLKHPVVGKHIVPIVPDEARTFGMESLFRQCGIYSHVGQVYEPVDANTLLYYREAKDGQILEEGITEAGSMASFTAAGTSYATHGIDMIPFFIFYSMFGFQRIGDLIWAFGDLRGRGFLLGATSGRTTLNGEGLQHEDGHSHVLASTIPNLLTTGCLRSFEGSPTVILAKTVKGYGLGEAGEGKNITHQQKKLNEKELIHFRNRFDIPIADSKIRTAKNRVDGSFTDHSYLPGSV